ncbi:MAG: ion transporter [Mariprofundaceae bacterium]
MKQAVWKDRSLVYHYLEWVFMHPRFGMFMVGLVFLSFLHDQILATILFVVFTIEVSVRIALFLRKVKLNPYRSSMNRKVDILLLCMDIIGILSLLITVFDIQIAGENVAFLRLMRAFYLLRTLRIFRYIDLHSAMFSPTYGMFISLVILVSFFASDMALTIILIFFFTELALRLVVLKSMQFASKRERYLEWAFWWIDLVATIFLLPFVEIVPYSSVLRMMRLVRLLRPWKIILTNLRDVMREGQFMQEINLIILILAILSIGGGVIANMTFGSYDYTLGRHPESMEDPILSAIWFAFRLLTDPGNSVVYPDTLGITIFTTTSVIIGVFVFAFFIGIGANIVSGLMKRLRNERLLVTNHLVILGWTSATPYITNQLRLIAERSFAKLKVILLHVDEHAPAEVVDEKWISYRHGDVEDVRDLQRVNLGSARQALLILPESQSEATSLAHSFYGMLAIRRMNRDIYLSIAIPGMDHPRLETHSHMLQVGWDNTEKYNKPTVVLSEADFRATAFCNILRYSDFDQVFQRLLIPELTEESGLQLADWDGKLSRNEAGEWDIVASRGDFSAGIKGIQAALFERGVILTGLIDEAWSVRPIYKLDEIFKPELNIRALLGIAISDSALYDEVMYCIRSENKQEEEVAPAGDLDSWGVSLVEPEAKMKLLIVGWVGSLPLLLKRLLRFYHELELTILDDVSEQEVTDNQSYIERRLAEEPGLEDLITIHIERWDFSDMERLRKHVVDSNHVILSRPVNRGEDAYAMISATLSHVVTIAMNEQVSPEVFPVLENRTQATLLQDELAEFELPIEVHVTVPNEFYGAFVSHTTFHMYTAVDDDTYQMKRALRHSLTKLMSDTGDDSDMGLKIFKVSTTLPDDPIKLFRDFQEAGYVLIGYTLKHPFHLEDPIQKGLNVLFPRQNKFTCQRQNHIILNPFGNPVSKHSWIDRREDIVELITIGGDDDVELF